MIRGGLRCQTWQRSKVTIHGVKNKDRDEAEAAEPERGREQDELEVKLPEHVTRDSKEEVLTKELPGNRVLKW